MIDLVTSKVDEPCAYLQISRHDPLVNFKIIAQTMMNPREFKSEIHAKLLEFYIRGTKSMDKREYRKAYDIFREGHDVYKTFQEKKGPKLKLGLIESNMIEHVVAGILGMASEALNREISAQRSMSTDGYTGPHLMAQEVKACDTSLTVMFTQFSLSSPRMTNGQRFHSHYRRAVAFSNLGDFLTSRCPSPSMPPSPTISWKHGMTQYSVTQRRPRMHSTQPKSPESPAQRSPRSL